MPFPAGPGPCIGGGIAEVVDRIRSHFAGAPLLLLSVNAVSVPSDCKTQFDQTAKRLRKRRRVRLVLRPFDDGRSQRGRRPEAHQRCKAWTLFRLACHLQRKMTWIEGMDTRCFEFTDVAE
jgi:hypothetical protein